MICRFCREPISEGSDVIEDLEGWSICQYCHDERLDNEGRVIFTDVDSCMKCGRKYKEPAAGCDPHDRIADAVFLSKKVRQLSGIE